MRLRPHRRNLVIWRSSAVSATKSSGVWALRGTRPSRGKRIRWWLRTGALLAVVGVLRLARTTRARWEPVSLLAGALLMVIGLMLPAFAGAFLLGILVLIVTLLKGIRHQRRGHDPASE